MVAEASWGPMAQSQSPPPAVWSGNPGKLQADPSCATRKALHPAGTPVGAITNDRPNRSVLMLGSAALLLPLSSRFGLNVAVGGAAANAEVGDTIDMTPTSATMTASAIRRCARQPPGGRHDTPPTPTTAI